MNENNMVSLAETIFGKREQICIWPQYALLYHIEDESTKLFIWEKEPVMGLSFISFGKDRKHAKENMLKLLELIPEQYMLLIDSFSSFVNAKEPKDITKDEIGNAIREETMRIELGLECRPAMLRPDIFIDLLNDKVKEVLEKSEVESINFEKEFRLMQGTLQLWLNENEREKRHIIKLI